ncbi:MAG: exodeoxyribonuclease VII small subunit [Gammaproteobacteria bacterium]|nr:exodeoxyribonuclease VII small subunit [Gammaproteobacteria bacterium]
MVKQKTTAADFETSLKELEQLVVSMEQGEMSLEDALKAFERGVELTRHCRDTLKLAEQRVSLLSQESGQLEAFKHDA